MSRVTSECVPTNLLGRFDAVAVPSGVRTPQEQVVQAGAIAPPMAPPRVRVARARVTGANTLAGSCARQLFQ